MRFRASLMIVLLWVACCWPVLMSAEEPAPAEGAPPASAAPDADAAGQDQPNKQAEEDAEYYELFKTFADTVDQVERNYVKDVSRREIMEAAIRGVLEQLDPYSDYIGPDDLGRFKTSVESQFGGIGIQVDVRDGRLIVVSPLVGSPAYRAGLQAGDHIVEIENESTEGIGLEEAIRRLKGEAGSSVTISVLHRDDTEKQTVTIQREIIRLDTVMGDQRDERDRWDFMLDDERGIGYIRLTAFSRETARDLERALKELKDQGLKGLVLDLRFNPGGLLTSAIEVADLFLEDGVIVSTAGRNSARRSWDARKPGTFTGFPMVVLVNNYSASASEIVAAALQDHKRAIVVGQRTWGKGSVQNVIELEGGKSALKLTTAAYQRPNGHNIHRFPDSKPTDEWGVMPDPGFEVKVEGEELGKLVRWRRDRDILLVNHYTPPSVAEKEPVAAETPSEANDEPAASEQPAATGAESGEAEEPASESEQPPVEESPQEEAGLDQEATSESGSASLDRQLQKAIEYLTAEVARAE